jgi:hypothetical protein
MPVEAFDLVGKILGRRNCSLAGMYSNRWQTMKCLME